MNAEIKQLWIDALLSGDYKQGKNVLHDTKTDRYCCLGVLCELAVQEGVVESFESIDCEDLERYGKDWEKAMLPDEVQEWAGIASDSGCIVLSESDAKRLRIAGRNVSLVHLNDAGKRFKTIAKVIEKYF